MPEYYNEFNVLYDNFGDKQKTNARYIWGYLGALGFTLNSVAAMLGNWQAESRLNPNVVETKAKDRWDEWGNYGYGLAQWTPWYTRRNKHTGEWEDPKTFHGSVNGETFGYWAEQKGYTTNMQTGGTVGEMKPQLDYISLGLGGWKVDSTYFKMTFDEFKKSTKNAGELAKVYYRNYERSEAASYGNRPSNALKWFEYLGGVTPPSPVPTAKILKGGKNVWRILHLIQQF